MQQQSPSLTAYAAAEIQQALHRRWDDMGSCTVAPASSSSETLRACSLVWLTPAVDLCSRDFRRAVQELTCSLAELYKACPDKDLQQQLFADAMIAVQHCDS